MSVNRIVKAMVAGCAVVVVSAVPVLAAQAPQEPSGATTGTVKPPAGMEAKCQAMVAEREKMMGDMKTADQRIDGLVATMNAAPDTEKLAAIANVVTEMVKQRRTLRDRMMTMQEGRMSHMMGHMEAGAASMAMCPMMKQMGGMKH
jgi:hypothetical protein